MDDWNDEMYDYVVYLPQKVNYVNNVKILLAVAKVRQTNLRWKTSWSQRIHQTKREIVERPTQYRDQVSRNSYERV